MKNNYFSEDNVSSLSNLHVWLIVFLFPIVASLTLIEKMANGMLFIELLVIFIILIVANIRAFINYKLLHYPASILLISIMIAGFAKIISAMLWGYGSSDTNTLIVIIHVITLAMFLSIIAIHVELLWRDRNNLRNADAIWPSLWWGLIPPAYILRRQIINDEKLNIFWWYLSLNVIAIPLWIGTLLSYS